MSDGTPHPKPIVDEPRRPALGKARRSDRAYCLPARNALLFPGPTSSPLQFRRGLLVLWAEDRVRGTRKAFRSWGGHPEISARKRGLGALRTPPTPRELRRKRARARRRVADTANRLAELVNDANREWILEGHEPEFDEDLAARRTEARLHVFAAGVRAEIARQGLRAGDLDVGLGWPDGRTEQLLAEPWELTLEEAELLCEELKTSMQRLFTGSGWNPTTEEP